MKRILILMFMFLGQNIFSQKVTDYQYVIVPKQFNFQKTENQYQINGLVKFLFEKYNFSPFWNDNLSEEVAKNPCNILKTDVKNNSNLFTTKVIITLTDCQGKIIFSSREGKSREKDFSKAYNEAIRDAFQDIKNLNYKYIEPKKSNEIVNQSEKNISEQSQKNTMSYPLLYAQPIENGYQLIDETPKVVLKIQKTSLEGIYNAMDINNISGIFYQKETYFIFEYVKNGQQEKLYYNVKF